MTEARIYNALIIAWLVIAAVTFIALCLITAPYGRHGRRGWGPEISSRTGWMLMEIPAALTIAICFALQPPALPGAWVFLGLWELHYINRAVIFPLRNPGGKKPMPLSVSLMAIFFNGVNGYLNGRGFTVFGPQYSWDYFAEPHVIFGIALFLTGFFINFQADNILFGLRKPGETGYKIPVGGMYRFISCPNYFGEIIEWVGFAIAAGSPAAWTFAAWTAANLAPRAFAHHRWYREKFPDYPRERRALFPFVA
jgi:3-oxo-5-alpha-steroid 4-dehydrogenase 1